MLADLDMARYSSSECSSNTIAAKTICNRHIRFTRKFGFITLITTANPISKGTHATLEQIMRKYKGDVLCHIVGNQTNTYRAIQFADVLGVRNVNLTVHLTDFDHTSANTEYPPNCTLAIDTTLESLASEECFQRYSDLHVKNRGLARIFLCLDAFEIASKPDIVQVVIRSLQELYMARVLNGIRLYWNRCWTERCTQYQRSLDDAMIERIAEFYTSLSFPVHFSMLTDFSYCGAEHNNHVFIDYSGEVYNCWDEFYRRRSTETRLDDDSAISKLSFLGKEIGDCEEYQNCKISPICYGGCTLKCIREGLLHSNDCCAPYRNESVQ